MTLPANSVFLPVLDDLLSPDLRPILQTPTADFCPGIPFNLGRGIIGGGRQLGSGFANVTSTADAPEHSAAKKINFKPKARTPEEEAASRKIQNWWRNRRHCVDVEVGAERAKHVIRHRRTEEHVQ